MTTELIKTATRADWLALRKSGIGGSDIAAIIGLNRFRGPYDVYMDKTTEADTAEETNEAIHFGILLEDIVAKEFTQRTGMKVQRINATLKNGICIANIDRTIISPAISGNVRFKDGALTTDALLECKTAGFHSAWRWGPSQEDLIIKGLPVPHAEMPVEYLAQIQWYMGITYCKTAYVAVLIGGQDYRIYRVDRDEEIIQSLYEAADEFWQHVQKGQPPEPKTAEEAAKTWHQDNGEAVEADNDTAAAFGELVTMKAQAKTLADQIAEKEDQIKMAIGQNTMLTLGGNKIATWKAGSRSTINGKAILADHPEINPEKYTKESTYRTLRIYA